LLLAAGVSFVLAYLEEPDEDEGLRAFIEPFVILLILIVNAFVGVWQESNAESALESLKELQSETAKCVRNGKLLSDLPSKELVPGDIVELAVGDRVPADSRVLVMKTATLRVEQSSLTGESVAVQKIVEPVAGEDVALQDKENTLFSGTAIANGKCTAIVTGIGMNTEIGKIQASITSASEEDSDTPLKQKLDEFGDLLTKIIGIICLLVWLINYHHFLQFNFDSAGALPSSVSFSLGRCTYYFKIAVALAVAAIPEGLPAVITTCLALGTRKMAQENAIVRRLPSVETLGCTTVICSDKTGTLTTNQMSATYMSVSGTAEGKLATYHIRGTTYSPEAKDGGIDNLPNELDVPMQTLAKICSLCNESDVELVGGKYRAVGAATEVALKVLTEKIGVPDRQMQDGILRKREIDPDSMVQAASEYWKKKYTKLATLEFDRQRKSMSVLVKMHGNANELLVKGAPEMVLDRCSEIVLADGSIVPLTARGRSAILLEVKGMTTEALRVLAFAYKQGNDLDELKYYDGSTHPSHKLLLDPSNYEKLEDGLTFVGLAGIKDPPRPEVSKSIMECKSAGIRVMMITGDNKNTAEAVAKNIGILDSDQEVETKSVTCSEFVRMSTRDQINLLSGQGGLVFSRAEPKHKQDIVRMLKSCGEVVAMTGDGVNDAPALKLADIGVAMGISGTEVAKDASDMILADDNFSTIVKAVAEGRGIFNNMKAFIRYMISSNIGEVVSIFLTAALGMPEGLIPVQLLWVNLVTDGPPATALGFNPPENDVMKKPPRSPKEALINGWVLFRYMVVGTYVGVATVAIFAVWYLCDSFMGIDLSKDGHSTISWYQLTHWQQCEDWIGFAPAPYTAGSTEFTFYGNDNCEYFTRGKAKASTLSLTVLVSIEMFNALNALSEDGSLVEMPPWVNPWLLVAISFSFFLHFLVLYIPVLASIFNIVPLSWDEWKLVLLFSLPVILLDEVLKFFGRRLERRAKSVHLKKE